MNDNSRDENPYTIKLGDTVSDARQGRNFFVGAVCPSGYLLLYEMTSTGVGLVLWRKSEVYDFGLRACDHRFFHLLPKFFGFTGTSEMQPAPKEKTAKPESTKRKKPSEFTAWLDEAEV